MLTNIIVSLAVCVVVATASNEWSYKNKDHWVDTCKTGTAQSPVNIIRMEAFYKKGLNKSPLKFSPSSTKKVVLSNNGHTVVASLKDDVIMSGIGLPNEYKVAQLHFHFGSNEKKGSEHTIDGKAYAMEMHIVTYAKHYDSLTDALNSGIFTSVAVLGTMFKQSANRGNLYYNDIFMGLNEIKYAASDIIIEQLNFTEILPSNTNNYYRYLGSLTTPPCTEGILWTVLEMPLIVSSMQMKMMRMYLKNSETNPMEDNFRSTMFLGKRKVIRTFLLPSESKSDYEATKLTPDKKDVVHAVEKTGKSPVGHSKSVTDKNGVRHVKIDLALKVDVL